MNHQGTLLWICSLSIMLLTSYAFRSQRSVPRVTARFAGAIVRSMPAKDLGAVLRSPARDTYQIVDVREKSELEMAALPTPGVIHLPMSEAKHWGGKIINAELLDRTRPTICLCHHGMRSMQMASFLGEPLPPHLMPLPADPLACSQ